MKIISDIHKTNLSEWERFVYNHPHANFFQSNKALSFFQQVNNYESVLIVARKHKEIVGSLLAVIIKEGTGLKGYFSRRCIVWGGPLIDGKDDEVFVSLLHRLERFVSSKCIYIEFRNFWDQTDYMNLFRKNAYNFNEHLNYIVQVSTLEESKAGLSKSKKRQVNKSLKSGAELVSAKNLKQIKQFYNLLYRLYKEKVRKPLPSFDFFSCFFQNRSLGTYILVHYENRIIGGIMCPIYKDTIYEWFVCGMDGNIKNVYPSVLATWGPIEYAANNGLKYFDFMGAGRPDENYGVREFKSKFGGNLVNYGRFVKVVKPFQYQIGKTGLQAYTGLRRFSN
jgi:lipid II:glycine glycyltransferase (peptidoglycan interpeptide bridge formation enzyme)